MEVLLVRHWTCGIECSHDGFTVKLCFIAKFAGQLSAEAPLPDFITCTGGVTLLRN